MFKPLNVKTPNPSWFLSRSAVTLTLHLSKFRFILVCFTFHCWRKTSPRHGGFIVTLVYYQWVKAHYSFITNPKRYINTCFLLWLSRWRLFCNGRTQIDAVPTTGAVEVTVPPAVSLIDKRSFSFKIKELSSLLLRLSERLSEPGKSEKTWSLLPHLRIDTRARFRRHYKLMERTLIFPQQLI